MATRVIPPRILRKLRYNTATKPFNPSSLSSPTLSPCFLDPKQPPASTTSSTEPSSTATTATTTLLPPSTDDLNFHDVQKLFSSLPTSKLLRSTAVLHATALEPMVDLGMWIMKSQLMQTENPLKQVALKAVKSSFYEHFCAGEDAVTAVKNIAILNDAGLRGMLVYGIEDALDNDACDRNLSGFLHTVDVSRSLPPSSKKNDEIRSGRDTCPL